MATVASILIVTTAAVAANVTTAHVTAAHVTSTDVTAPRVTAACVTAAHVTAAQCTIFYTLSGRIGKVVASHAAVARASPAEVALIYSMHVALRGYCP